PTLAQSTERYLRDPRLVARRDGGAELHAIAWGSGGEAHVVWPLDAEGAVCGPERIVEQRDAILGLTHDTREPRVAHDPSSEEEARDGAWSARIERHGGTSRVMAVGAAVGPVVVWEADAIAAAPAIVASGEGAWI